MRNDLPSSFLELYDACYAGGLKIPGDFFITNMTTLKKYGIYEHLLLYEYIEGEVPILNTKTEILLAAFSACNREKLRELCEDVPDDRLEYTVYRGSIGKRKLSISWSLCQLHATHFACNAYRGRLYKTTVLSQDVLAFFGEYFGENELMIIPKPEDIIEIPILPEIRKMMNKHCKEGFCFPSPYFMPDKCKDICRVCPNKICLKQSPDFMECLR